MKINKVAAGDQGMALLASVGSDAYEVLFTACYPAEPDTKTFKELKEILLKHYHSPRNVLTERIKFRERKQKEGESVADFALALKKLSMMCKFENKLEGNLKEAFSSEFALHSR